MLNSERTIKYLGIYEGSSNSNGSSKCVDGLNWRVEDDDWGDNDRYPFHGVSNAKCQGRDLIQGHIWHLVVEMIEHTLGCHPPARTINSHIINKRQGRRKTISYFSTNNGIQTRDTMHTFCEKKLEHNALQELFF
jgi:hypothetical protein